MNKLNEKERIRINCENYIKNEDYIKKWSSKNNGNKKNNFELKYEIKNILKKKKKDSFDHSKKFNPDKVYKSWNKLFSKFYQK